MMNGEDNQQSGDDGSDRTLLELYVKASGIDHKRIGACLFCQEFWMELYALYEVNAIRLEVKTVNVNSEPFKKSFLGAQPPILINPLKQTQYTDNREIEGCIFHTAKGAHVPLFEKDINVERAIENLFRNFKLFLKAKVEASPNSEGNPGVLKSQNNLVDQLGRINEVMKERNSRYLLGHSMTQYDCELMPRLHHIRVAGEEIGGLSIPHHYTHLWNYILTMYRTAAFIESCPVDQDILHHYKESFKIYRQRDSLQQPTKTQTIPEEVLREIQASGMDNI